jgi:hypothetical protein
MTDIKRDELGAPKIVDRSTFHAELDALRGLDKRRRRHCGGPPTAADDRCGRHHTPDW